MQDGQNLFDPKTSAFGIDWQLDETADSLIKSKAIREIIIVGIYNTQDRNIEYLDTKPGHQYMDFVVNKLKPFIDKNFRTLPDRKNTAVGGSSAGALISFMLLWEHPDIFSKAACLSPAFHIDDIDYIPKVSDYNGFKKKVRFYIDVGTEGLDAKLKPGAEEMIKALENKGYKENKDFEFFIAKGAVHNEAAWGKRNWRYLKFMFGKK
jgi:predicted alpha/beta superfamily hydrolase